MTQVDTLLLNAHVLNMDETMTQFPRGAVALTGDSIVAVGPEAEIKKGYTGKEVFDCKGRVLMPGLDDAHTHVPMTLLRGIADDLVMGALPVQCQASDISSTRGIRLPLMPLFRRSTPTALWISYRLHRRSVFRGSVFHGLFLPADESN